MTHYPIGLNLITKLLHIAVFLFFIPFSSSAQNDRIIALENHLTELKEDTAIVNILNELSYEYYPIDIEKTFYYSQKALNKAKILHYQKGISQALNYLAIGYAIKGDQQKSIDINEESLEIARALDDHFLMANALNALGISYQEIGLTEKSLTYYLESLSHSKKGGDKKLECFTLGNIGYLYHDLKDEEKAIDYYMQAAEVAKNSDHHMIKYLPDLNLGNIYLKDKKYELAYSHYELSLSKSSDALTKSDILKAMADCFREQKRYDEALEKSLEAMQLIKETGNKESLPYAAIAHANLLFEAGEYEKCIQQVKDMLEYEKVYDISIFNMRNLYQLQAKAFLKLNAYESAAFSFEEVVALQDSIFSTEQLSIVSEIETKYQVKEKEKENAYLRLQQEQSAIIIAQKKRTSWFTIVLLMLVTTIAALFLNAFWNKKKFNLRLQDEVALTTIELKKSNKQLKASNKELERFAYIASHDLREPLRNISSFTSLVERELKSYELQTNIKEYMDFIRTNTLQMSHLIKDVLEFSKLEGIKPSLKETDLAVLINEVQTTLQGYIEEKGAFISVPNNLPTITTYPGQLFLIFKNLIQNGLKYNTSEKPTIKIEYFNTAGYHKFIVTDNGIGIPPEFKSHIFEMFKRLHNRTEYQGTGLGLAICKKMLTKMGGQIWLEESNVGSRFCFIVPMIGPPNSLAENNMVLSNIDRVLN